MQKKTLGYRAAAAALAVSCLGGCGDAQPGTSPAAGDQGQAQGGSVAGSGASAGAAHSGVAGGSGAGSHAEGPCLFLTAAEAERALGVPRAQPVGEHGCTFRLDQDSDLAIGIQWMSRTSFDRQMPSDSTPVPGLGDAAYYRVPEENVKREVSPYLAVIRGKHYLEVSVATTAPRGKPPVPGDVRSKLTTVAKLAISHGALD